MRRAQIETADVSTRDRGSRPILVTRGQAAHGHRLSVEGMQAWEEEEDEAEEEAAATAVVAQQAAEEEDVK